MKTFYLLITSLVLLSCSTEKKSSLQVYSGQALGTTFQLQFFHPNELELSSAIDSTFSVLNQSLSTYISNSDISKINSGDTTVTVDQQLVDNFMASKQIYKATQGFFDPTVGLMVNAYGFGPETYNLQMNSRTIDSLMTYVGFDKVFLTAENKLKKAHLETYLDFNSIAKGYAVDRLAVLLNQFGVQHYLVEVGGELVAKGKQIENQEVWKIGIDNPEATSVSDRELLQYIVKLENRAMATSGNYRKFKTDADGNKFVHTINPKTGRSEASDVLSASVFAEDCMTADAYATAFMAMGFEKTMMLLPDLENIEVILIYSKGEEVKTYISEGLNKYVIK
ncbi:FAD:protein FMN transferase [Psychroflexus salis]|uniref:FAD:protein FMN transferase n=1 Tax=Psychroflexus salis TaxID=1526574 RepID=A0A916ZSJ9_9FLAO|nr:FAD:protein FMN transferase [Psychroflexus salis]GGE12251.1 FAD:protein FMN transferase [Psychroflexus salis]